MIRTLATVRWTIGTVAALVLWGSVAVEGASADTQTFTVPGSSVFTVPAGVKAILVSAIGAAGGDCFDATGGKGAVISGVVAVTPGQKLYVGVGRRTKGSTGRVAAGRRWSARPSVTSRSSAT